MQVLLLISSNVVTVIGLNVFISDPNTLVKDSNDLQMIARPERMPTQYPYVGVGTKLTIQRNGVIKRWRFYSSSAGWSVFQVWRPDPAAGQFR